MKTSFVITVVALCLLFSRASLAQNGGMMNGGRGDVWMGGYGGILVPGLLVIVVAGLVMWFVKQKGK